MPCKSQDSTIIDRCVKSLPLEGATAPVGSQMNLAQALTLAAGGEIDGSSEIWVRSFSQPLNPQMSAIVAIGSSLSDELNSNWHLACLACDAAELEVDVGLGEVDIDVDALFWAKRGMKLSEAFEAYPAKIIGRCNELTRGKYWSKAVSDYMDYKSLLKVELNIPEDLVKAADGIVIEAEFGLPKSCLKKDGTPTLEGDRRLKGLVKSIPQDWDNLGKPIQDAVAETEGNIKDASIMTGLVTKKWGMENKITVRLLLPLEN